MIYLSLSVYCYDLCTFLSYFVIHHLFLNIFAYRPDSKSVLEVLILAFERLYAELDPMELTFIWKCLLEKITDSVTNGNSVHLSCLLTLLISMVQNDYLGKIAGGLHVVLL